MTDLARVALDDEREIPLARVSGEIDLSNTEELAETLERSVTEGTGLVVDLSGVTYLDSAGVRLLFQLAERLGSKGKRFRIVVPDTAAIRKVLLVAAVDRAVPVDSSIDQALAAMSPPSA